VSYLTHLECTVCSKQYDSSEPHNLCTCGAPLFARYDLKKVASKLLPQQLQSRTNSLWRWRELLPVNQDSNIVSSGEGGTPLISTTRLAKHLGLKNLMIKDESFNPTGSFKARGMSVAISKAKELGLTKICIPSAGNAGSAASAYGAKAGIEVNVFMPQDVEPVYQSECRAFGAKLTLHGKNILEAGREMKRVKSSDWFDFSTLKEPYRVEGKKTMGYELAEQFNWKLPQAIFYPTGGGTGLIGLWKAFEELQELGWIGTERPKMYVIQAEGCAPLVKAFKEGQEKSEEWPDPQTQATGIKVPKALADFLILKIVRESGGQALSVSEAEMKSAFKLAARLEGIMLCPEGAAALAGLFKLVSAHEIELQNGRLVVLNTGSAFKYQRFLNQI
jgi:threonine synthase